MPFSYQGPQPEPVDTVKGIHTLKLILVLGAYTNVVFIN